MAITEAKKISNKKWNDANLKNYYDRISYMPKKGYKEILQVQAKKAGQSLNAYITQACDERMEREGIMTYSNTNGKIVYYSSEYALSKECTFICAYRSKECRSDNCDYLESGINIRIKQGLTREEAISSIIALD